MKQYRFLTTVGVSLVLAAACSDDDAPFPGGGGAAGTGGTSTAGTAGTAGGGTAGMGTAGTTAGSAGSAAGGTGGSSAGGAGGSPAAGSGGSMPSAGMGGTSSGEPDASAPDAGLVEDAGFDASVPPIDSGFAGSGAGGTGAGGSSAVPDAGGGAAGAEGDQDVDGPLPASLGNCPAITPTIGGTGGPLAIADLRFTDSNSAIIVFANVSNVVQSIGTELFVCNGTANCHDLGRDLTDFGDAGVDFQINGHFTVEIPNTVAAGGEIAIFSNDPNNTPVPPEDGGLREFPLYFVQWGAPIGGTSLAQRVVDEGTGFWLDAGDRVTIGTGDTGFVGTGAANVPGGYASCNHGVSGG